MKEKIEYNRSPEMGSNPNGLCVLFNDENYKKIC